MRKTITVLAIAITLASCGNQASKTAQADSTTAKRDTLYMPMYQMNDTVPAAYTYRGEKGDTLKGLGYAVWVGFKTPRVIDSAKQQVQWIPVGQFTPVAVLNAEKQIVKTAIGIQ